MEDREGTAARGAEIAQLARDLEHTERARREEAYNRLLEIGPSVLWQLRFAAQNGNPEWRRLFFQLIGAIQDKHGIQSVRDNGLEFLPFADPVWCVPPPGGQTPIKLGVTITNVGEKAVRFCLFGTIQPHLNGPDGQSIKAGGGMEGLSLKNEWSPPLAKGQSQMGSNFRVKLCRSDNGKELWLALEDDFGKFYCFGGLKPGRYYLRFECGYKCDDNEMGSQGGWILKPREAPRDGIPTWYGQTSTPFVAVEIR
jgi:hypothetical protein